MNAWAYWPIRQARPTLAHATLGYATEQFIAINYFVFANWLLPTHALSLCFYMPFIYIYV